MVDKKKKLSYNKSMEEQQFVVRDVDTALLAGTWCKDNITRGDWKLEMINWGSNYRITIEDGEMFSIAALKFAS
jgi:hypothetical protein